MSPSDILAEDKRDRLMAVQRDVVRRDPLQPTGSITVATVDDSPLIVKRNRMQQAVRRDVIGQIAQFVVRQHRKQIGYGVNLSSILAHKPSLIPSRSFGCAQ